MTYSKANGTAIMINDQVTQHAMQVIYAVGVLHMNGRCNIYDSCISTVAKRFYMMRSFILRHFVITQFHPTSRMTTSDFQVLQRPPALQSCCPVVPGPVWVICLSHLCATAGPCHTTCGIPPCTGYRGIFNSGSSAQYHCARIPVRFLSAEAIGSITGAARMQAPHRILLPAPNAAARNPKR